MHPRQRNKTNDGPVAVNSYTVQIHRLRDDAIRGLPATRASIPEPPTSNHFPAPHGANRTTANNHRWALTQQDRQGDVTGEWQPTPCVSWTSYTYARGRGYSKATNHRIRCIVIAATSSRQRLAATFLPFQHQPKRPSWARALKEALRCRVLRALRARPSEVALHPTTTPAWKKNERGN